MIKLKNLYFKLVMFSAVGSATLMGGSELESMDYKVITVWECELKDCFDYRMQKLVEEILDGSY